MGQLEPDSSGEGTSITNERGLAIASVAERRQHFDRIVDLLLSRSAKRGARVTLQLSSSHLLNSFHHRLRDPLTLFTLQLALIHAVLQHKLKIA